MKEFELYMDSVKVLASGISVLQKCFVSQDTLRVCVHMPCVPGAKVQNRCMIMMVRQAECFSVSKQAIYKHVPCVTHE